MYLHTREGLGQIPTTLQPRNLTGPEQPPQCEAIPEKYKLRDSKDKLTSGRVNCPTRADAVRILRTTIARAVEMLDKTIGELVRAREAACRGEPLGRPALGDVTACWLKYRLGVCIDDLSVWTRGTFRKSLTEPVSVAEVIRRLVQPRNLLASNAVTYVCDATCPGQRVAWVVVRTQERGDSVGTGLLIHPRLVLTCAHVVFPPQARSRTVSVEVTPGQNGDAAPLGGPFGADTWLASPGWNASAPCEHDFALVRLPKPTGVGVWPISSVSAQFVTGVDVHHAGYPSCRAGDPAKQMVRGIGQILGAIRYDNACVVRDKLEPIDAATRTVAHTIPTCPSQSGGPLWIVDVCTRNPVVVAIHQGRVANGRFGRAIFLGPAILTEVQP
ncbi:MAG: trypsin-like serine peptidase [Blastocatellia bacterium]